jgi:hypothetical protein
MFEQIHVVYSIEKEITCLPGTTSCACQFQLCLENTNSFTVVLFTEYKAIQYITHIFHKSSPYKFNRDEKSLAHPIVE